MKMKAFVIKVAAATAIILFCLPPAPVHAYGAQFLINDIPVGGIRSHERITFRAVGLVLNQSNNSLLYDELSRYQNIIGVASNDLDQDDIAFYSGGEFIGLSASSGPDLGFPNGTRTHYRTAVCEDCPPGAYEEAIYDQISFHPIRGRRFWPNAIEEYGKGNYDIAFQNLGYTVHLLEDMGSPTHVYLIEHGVDLSLADPFLAIYGYTAASIGLNGPDDVWEHEVATPDAINSINLSSVSPVILTSLKDYFQKMANNARDSTTELGDVTKNALISLYEEGAYHHDNDGDSRFNEDPLNGINDDHDEVLTTDADGNGVIRERIDEDGFEDQVPASDPAYDTLVNHLLPSVVAHTAGLLKHYHDIVNQVNHLALC